MPYINNEVSKKMTVGEKTEIKSGLGKILEETIGKSERVLMVKVSDNNDIWFSGDKGEYAFIEIKLLGQVKKEDKDIIATEINKLYDKVIGIKEDKIYIVFDQYERENWAFKGKTFA